MKYTKEDFIYGTPPRIMGSETEYTTSTVVPSESTQIIKHIDGSKALVSSSPDNEDSVWLKNGAHIYVDYGDLHEYASPECTSANELLLYEKAGEEIIQAAATATLPIPLDRVYKRAGYAEVILDDDTVIHRSMSTGHHENYYFPFTKLIPAGSVALQELNAYLSTRAIWSGTGMVNEDGYNISQKADSINFLGKAATDEGSKPPYRIHEDDSRLEIRTGEGNMSEWAIVQKFAMTSLVLRLIEHGRFPIHLITRVDPNYIMSSVSHDPKVHLAPDYDMQYTAATHQRMIAQHALDFAEHQPNIPDEEIHAAEEIIRATSEIDQYLKGEAPLSAISNRIDWAAKYDRMLQKGFQKSDFTTDNLEAVMHDLSWENVSKRGISRLWYKHNNGVFTAKPDDIERAHYVPPATRAQKRTQAIRDASKNGMVNFVGWERVDSDHGMVSMPDPYAAQTSRFLLLHLEQHDGSNHRGLHTVQHHHTF